MVCGPLGPLLSSQQLSKQKSMIAKGPRFHILYTTHHKLLAHIILCLTVYPPPHTHARTHTHTHTKLDDNHTGTLLLQKIVVVLQKTKLQVNSA